MELWRFFTCLLILGLQTGELRAAFKSNTSSSLKLLKTQQGKCTKCKVTHKVGNHTVSSGGRVTLKCAFDGISKKDILWLKDGKPIRPSKRVKSLDFNNNGLKLRIKEVSNRDRGLYTCVGRNSQGLEIVSKGYLKLRTKPKLQTISRVGKCEPYKGTICLPYISSLIFVDTQAMENSQEFVEKRLSFGYSAIHANLSDSCEPLPLWCHYNFPECTISNSNAEPKMICREDCETIKTNDCKAEYALSKRGQSQNGDDLFPDCSRLPRKTAKPNCVSLINRHLPRPGPGIAKGGRCVTYSGAMCPKKRGKKVFIPTGVKQGHIEKDISNTRKMMNSQPLSKKCQPYVPSLLCQVKLPDCDTKASPPAGKPICKDECLVLKNRYCKTEYSSADKFADSGLVFDCSSVKQFTYDSGKCSVIGIPEKDLKDHDLVDDKSVPPPPRVGFCAPYTGKVCQGIIGTKRTIFIDSDNAQANVETKVQNALGSISTFPELSAKCKPFVLPLMCHHLFPYCDPTPGSTQPQPSAICRRDCLHIQHHFCPSETALAEKQSLVGNILFPRCADLEKDNKGCTSLRKYYTPNKTGPILGDCFTDTGVNYRGYANTTESGETCLHWDNGKHYSNENAELLGGHNFCRNPGGKREKPWCWTNDAHTTLEWCDIPKCVEAPFNGTGEDYLGTINISTSGKACENWNKRDVTLNWSHNYCRNPSGQKRSPWCYVGEDSWEYCEMSKEKQASTLNRTQLSNLLYTVIPCVVFGLVVGTVIIAICWKRHKQGPDSLEKSPQPTVTMFVPELKTIPVENIVVAKLVGNGRFGAVFNGEIRSLPHDSHHMTRFLKVSAKEGRNDFVTQAMKWSQFHHPNILTVEAMATGDDPITLVYEAASHGSLYQYLIHHSPNNPTFTRDHALLTKENLVDISRQIAAGMTYLSSHGYIHGDLMTRNCQVAHSMVIKITDFSIDHYVCYYRQPNKLPIPIGWMAPEVIHSEVCTVYSDIWAFGVLLWEVFTYGFQPYFGYTFPEVQKKIVELELLECPRDCIPFVYDIMRSCWRKNPSERPQFFDLHEILNNLSNELVEEVDSDEIRPCLAGAST